MEDSRLATAKARVGARKSNRLLWTAGVLVALLALWAAFGSADETGGRFAVGSRAAAQAQSWRKRNIEPDCSSEWHMLALRLSDRPQPPAAASRNLTASTGTPESL